MVAHSQLLPEPNSYLSQTRAVLSMAMPKRPCGRSAGLGWLSDSCHKRLSSLRFGLEGVQVQLALQPKPLTVCAPFAHVSIPWHLHWRDRGFCVCVVKSRMCGNLAGRMHDHLASMHVCGVGVQVSTKNGSGASGASPGGITLLHLLLVAVVAYILGVYLR